MEAFCIHNPVEELSFNLPTNSAFGADANTLTRIYEESINIAVFQRTPSDAVISYAKQLIHERPAFRFRTIIEHQSAKESIASLLPDIQGKDDFVEDLYLLTDMYACLFDLKEVGIRLEAADKASCPRFHTDKLGCRLISTYLGEGTEWLANAHVDRSKLGRGSGGLKDSESGLLKPEHQIQQVNAGDVVLLKGEGWINNEEHGIVHRSPTVAQGHRRLVVTMDFA